MRRFVASKLAAVAATAVLIAFGGVNVPSVAADTGTQACQDEFHLQDPGNANQTPVVFVHGWMGDVSAWDPMNSMLLKDQGVFPTRFNYKDDHNKWVTHPNIGPKLAREIDCLARLYHKDVAVVAHSMGGLAALQAGNETVGGRKVSDVMGLLITIGTPYLGSPLGNVGTTGLQWLCNDTASRLPADQQRSAAEHCLDGSAIKGLAQGSSELGRLPKLPDTVPIRNIAGDMTATAWTIWGNRTVDSDSDMVVSTTSATANHTDKGVGDGQRVFECEAQTAGFGYINNWCDHNQMPKAPQVQADVKASIERYLASAKAAANPLSALPPHRMAKLFGKIELPYLNGWSASSSDSEGEMIDDGTHCDVSAEDCPSIYIRPLSYLPKQRYTNCWEGYQRRPGDFVGPMAATVGGEPAEYYQSRKCSDDVGVPDKEHTWIVPSKMLMIDANDGDDQAVSVDDLKAVLAHIRWLK